eukprot:7750497-Alexandrium_andersonii.AAC.1
MQNSESGQALCGYSGKRSPGNEPAFRNPPSAPELRRSEGFRTGPGPNRAGPESLGFPNGARATPSRA